MKCPRCGDPFEPSYAKQTRCLPCEREVAAIVAKDAERHAVKGAAGWRFVAKELALSEAPL